jgi:DNA-binding response OmpR family regulator
MKIRILYIEDEPSLAKIVSETLESKNFEVKHLLSAIDILSVVESFHPHLCIFDVMLPDKDGYTLATELRQSRKDLPIIFVTAKTQSLDLVQGFNSGGNDYIKKPFSLEELILRINNLHQLCYQTKTTPQEQASTQYSIGYYTYNSTTYDLIKGDTIRRLSFRESEILTMLLENEIVQRNELLLKLWGDNSFFNSRNLDVYITKLRSYFKEDENVEIITLKGVGYRMVIEK